MNTDQPVVAKVVKTFGDSPNGPKLLASIATRWLAITTVLLCGAANVSASEPTVTATASTNSVQVAEPFTVDITVNAPAGAKVAFPAIADRLGEFDVRDSQDRFDVPTANGRTWARRIELESIATGDLVIPSLDIQVSEGEIAKLVQTQPINVRVVSVLEDRSDPTKFRDIQTVVDVNVPEVKSGTWMLWAMGGVAGACLCAIAGLVLSRRGQWLTPKAWAIEELDELESLIDTNSVDCETTAQKLSEIVRSYLLLEFGIEDAGRTPQELVNEIVATERIAKEATDRLSTAFMLADKVRFAGVELSASAMKSAVNDSRELIERIANEFESSRSRQTLGRDNKPHPIPGEAGHEDTTEKN
ncbi:BatD family protein [Planctomycetes bacterium TBK1r]|uniref:Protein BatD n=1 Tax=Stieleria magnilauensis TaxID=2527963 RepID=A0ABX5XUZ7_9BACT|nr:hypothetical protein TBK1r_48740 [Planctomycetes bacterium TBK1r]